MNEKQFEKLEVTLILFDEKDDIVTSSGPSSGPVDLPEDEF